MANTAINHDPVATFPGSSTNTAVVKWSGTSGNALLDSGVIIDGSNNVTGLNNVTATGYLHLTGDEKELRFYEGANYIAIAAPSGLGADYTFTLPLNDGAADEFLQTNGSGVLTWAAAAGTTINNNANNFVITGSGTASTLEAESTFTYTGTAMMIGLASSPPTPDHTSVHIWEGSAGSLTSSTDMQLVVENSGNAGIAIMSPNANTTQLAFGSPQDNRQGGVLYDHNNNTLQLRASGTTRTTISSSVVTLAAGNTLLIEHTGAAGALIDIKHTSQSGTGANGTVRIQDQNNTQVGYMGKGSSNGTFQVLNESAAEMTFGTSGYTRLTIAANGTLSGSATNDISDQRIKENIEDTTVGLAEVLQLRPVKYNFMAGKGWGEPGQKFYGFLAQEVEAIIPEAVETADIDIDEEQAGSKRDPNGIPDLKSVTMTQITTALVKAVQELDAKVTALGG